MNKKKDITDELRDLAPGLQQLKEQDKDGFTVPEGYFTELQEDLFWKARQEVMAIQQKEAIAQPTTQAASWWQWLWQARMAVVSLTTVVVLAIGAWFLLTQNNASETTGSLAISDLSAEEIEAYLRANAATIETELIVEAAGSYETLAPLLPGPNLEGEDSEALLEELLDELEMNDIFWN